jgi:hypothetical protein
MRMPPSVEEDQVASLRPDDGAVPLDCAGASRGRVVRENELAADLVIGTEEQPGQGIGIDMAFKAHRASALDIQHDSVPVIESGHDRLSGRFPG